MKKPILCLIFLFAHFVQVKGGIFKGGDIEISKLNSPTGNMYSISVRLLIDWPVQINKPYIHFSVNNIVDSLPHCGSNCTFYNTTTLFYCTTMTWAPSSSYTVVVVDSFYVGYVSNISNPTAAKLVLKSIYNTSYYNSTPKYTLCGMDSFACGMTSYQVSAWDNDGDSLSYSIATPTHIANYSLPPATVDIYGSVHFSPGSSKKDYVVSVKIEEWRPIQVNGPRVKISTNFRELYFTVPTCPVGIKQIDGFSYIKISTNPVDDLFEFRKEQKDANIWTYMILNSRGDIILNEHELVFNTALKFPEVSSGLYFVLISQNSSLSQFYKVIKY